MAIQYSKVDQKNLTNAVTKAKKIKPLVKVLDFGRFEVTGSDGTPYNVTFYKSFGELTFTCTCTGHKRSLVCYHSVACSSIYKLQVKNRAAEKVALEVLEAPAPAPIITFCECGAELPLPGDTACADCILDAQNALFGDAPVRRERVKEAM